MVFSNRISLCYKFGRLHAENLPVQLKKMKDYIPIKERIENLYENWMDIEDIKSGFTKKGFKVIDTEDGSYAVKHRIGHVGSSVTHLGIVIIILGALIGNMFVKEGYITLAPGEIYEFNEYGYF